MSAPARPPGGGARAAAGRSGLSRYTLGLPVVLALALALLAPDFLQWQNLANISAQTAGLLIVSLGQMLVAVVAGIDLSVGSVVSLTSALVAVIPDPAAAVAAAVLAGALVGLVNGLGVTVGAVHPLVMTLSTMIVVQGLTYAVLPIPGGRMPDLLAALSNGTLAGLPGPLWWCLACLAVLAAVLHRTRFGLHLFATGANEQSARLNGLRTTAVIVAAYVGSSLLAVVAGLYLSARIGSGDPTLGAALGLESVTAVALGGVLLTGGVGSLTGVVTGALSLGLVNNGINLLGVSPFLRGTFTGVLLIVAVCAQRRRIVGL